MNPLSASNWVNVSIAAWSIPAEVIAEMLRLVGFSERDVALDRPMANTWLQRLVAASRIHGLRYGEPLALLAVLGLRAENLRQFARGVFLRRPSAARSTVLRELAGRLDQALILHARRVYGPNGDAVCREVMRVMMMKDDSVFRRSAELLLHNVDLIVGGGEPFIVTRDNAATPVTEAEQARAVLAEEERKREVVERRARTPRGPVKRFCAACGSEAELGDGNISCCAECREAGADIKNKKFCVGCRAAMVRSEYPDNFGKRLYCKDCTRERERRWRER